MGFYLLFRAVIILICSTSTNTSMLRHVRPHIISLMSHVVKTHTLPNRVRYLAALIWHSINYDYLPCFLYKYYSVYWGQFHSTTLAYSMLGTLPIVIEEVLELCQKPRRLRRDCCFWLQSVFITGSLDLGSLKRGFVCVACWRAGSLTSRMKDTSSEAENYCWSSGKLPL